MRIGLRKSLFASFLFTHNLKVGLVAMSLGVLAGVPTVLLMLYNGMILGAFLSVYMKAGLGLEVWAWILPHGITELTATVLCGGVGLVLSRAVISPGLKTRAEALVDAGAEAGRTAIGVAGMLVMAAFIESFVRQSHLTTNERLLYAAADRSVLDHLFRPGIPLGERGPTTGRLRRPCPNWKRAVRRRQPGSGQVKLK